LFLVCPNCHRLADTIRPREIEFVRYLEQLITTSEEFREVQVETPIDVMHGPRVVADILVEQWVSSGWRKI
jgi:hypothetical protein